METNQTTNYEPRAIMDECLTIMRAFAQSTAEAQASYLQLLAESESRIKQTNEMVFNLVSVIKELKDTYERSIEKLSKSKDKVTEQNTLLIKELTKLEEELERERALNHEIIQHFFNNTRASQNFNLTQK